MVRKLNQIQCVFLFAVGFAVYTQFPNVNKGAVSIINEALWMVMLFLTLLPEKKIYLTSFFKDMLLLLGYLLVMSLLLMITGVYHTFNIFMQLLPIPILLYYTSYVMNLKEENSIEWLNCILLVYLAVSTIMALQIAYTFRSNFASWSSSVGNMYAGATHKNSTGQLLGASFLILFLYVNPRKTYIKIGKYCILAVYLMALLYVQSRSALVAIIASIVLNAFFKGDYKKSLNWIVGICIVAFLIYKIDFLNRIFRQAFFIDKYSQGGQLDLNKFSSGRLGYWETAWQVFSDNSLVGIGNYYVDNFYFNVLACCGVVIGIPVVTLFWNRIYLNLKIVFLKGYNSKDSINQMKITELLGVITIFYIVISFFEAYPPYGPGVSCMIFWLLAGFIDGAHDFS